MDARRIVTALVWAIALALGVASSIAPGNLYGLAAWTIAVGALFGSASCDTGPVLLARSPVYRGIALVLLVVAIAGCFATMLPGAGDISSLYVPYLFAIAILAYRALVGTSRTGSMWTAAVALSGWIPFAMLTAIPFGCPRHGPPPEPPAANAITYAALTAVQLLAGALEIAALVTRPRSSAIARYR